MLEYIYLQAFYYSVYRTVKQIKACTQIPYNAGIWQSSGLQSTTKHK